MFINTNLSAQNTALLLQQSTQNLQQSLARLSSGSKINSPADDPAGLAVSMNFNAQIGNAQAAGNNVANATSFSQTQDGYLQQVGSALDRMSELAVQAQDVTKSNSDRALYNQEFQTLATFVNSVGTQSFNGVSLFSGNTLNVTTDPEGGTFGMTGISGDFLTNSTLSTPSTPSVTYVPDSESSTMGELFQGFTFGSIVVTNSSDVIASNDVYQDSTLGEVASHLNWALSAIGTGSANYNSQTGQLSVTMGPGEKLDQNESFYTYPSQLLTTLGFNVSDLDNSSGSSPLTVSTMLTTPPTPSSPAPSTPSTPSSTLDVSTAEDAKAALASITTAISNLASARATVGANEERLTYTSQQLSTLQNNLTAANSNITDVDVAQESTNYAKYNILVQTGTAMLAQANSMPQSVLKLLS
jgi:flagellin